jgi:hypothetical protein
MDAAASLPKKERIRAIGQNRNTAGALCATSAHLVQRFRGSNHFGAWQQSRSFHGIGFTESLHERKAIQGRRITIAPTGLARRGRAEDMPATPLSNMDNFLANPRTYGLSDRGLSRSRPSADWSRFFSVARSNGLVRYATAPRFMT